MAFWLGLLSVSQKIKEGEWGYDRYFSRRKNKYPCGDIVGATQINEPRMVSKGTV